MNLVGDCRVVGVSTGEGQRGTYYNVSVICDGEPFRLACTQNVYNLAKTLEFGAERKLVVDLRLYGRDWGLRITDLVEV